MSRVVRRVSWTVASLAFSAAALVPGVGARSQTPKPRTTKAIKRPSNSSGAASGSVLLTATPIRVTTSTTVATLPPETVPPFVPLTTTSAPPTASLLAPATTAVTATTTTIGGSTTTTSTTSAAAASSNYDYALRISVPTQTVLPGRDFTVIVIADPKVGPLQAVTLIPVGIPPGVSMVLDQNPMIGAAQLKVTIPQFIGPGTYEFRMAGSSGGVSRSATVGFVIPAPTTTTTTTSPPTTVASSTTVATIVRPAFKFSLVISGVSGTLVRGGSVSITVTATRDPGNTDKIALSTTDLPKNVWSGFSSAEVATTSTLWLSSTEVLVAGTYTFNLVVSSGGYSQSIPLSVILA